MANVMCNGRCPSGTTGCRSCLSPLRLSFGQHPVSPLPYNSIYGRGSPGSDFLPRQEKGFARDDYLMYYSPQKNGVTCAGVIIAPNSIRSHRIFLYPLRIAGRWDPFFTGDGGRIQATHSQRVPIQPEQGFKDQGKPGPHDLPSVTPHPGNDPSGTGHFAIGPCPRKGVVYAGVDKDETNRFLASEQPAVPVTIRYDSSGIMPGPAEGASNLLSFFLEGACFNFCGLRSFFYTSAFWR